MCCFALVKREWCSRIDESNTSTKLHCAAPYHMVLCCNLLYCNALLLEPSSTLLPERSTQLIKGHGESWSRQDTAKAGLGYHVYVLAQTCPRHFWILLTASIYLFICGFCDGSCGLFSGGLSDCSGPRRQNYPDLPQDASAV